MTVNMDDLLRSEEQIIDEIRGKLSLCDAIVGLSDPSAIKVAYASSPVTTGERLYSSMEHYGILSAADFKKSHSEVYKEIMSANIKSGDDFARNLLETKQYRDVIAPSKFFRRGWAQEHYMSFWERVIERFVTHIHLNEGWEYSNGCVEECLIGFKTGKQVYDGLVLTSLAPAQAARKIKSAMERAGKIGVDVKQLYNFYRRIELIS